MTRVVAPLRDTALLQPNQIIEVSGDAVATITRLRPGGQPYAPIAYTGVTRKFGPFGAITSVRMDVSFGTLDYTVRDYIDGLDDPAASWSGWVDVIDLDHTEIAPFQPPEDVWSPIYFPNVTVVDQQKPVDVEAMFDITNSKIIGRNGDGLGVTIELTAKPTTNTITYLDVAMDIGGAVGRIYLRELGFPRGVGVPRTTSFSFFAYTLDTWEANGANIVFRPNASVDIYDFRMVLTRTHKAR